MKFNPDKVPLARFLWESFGEDCDAVELWLTLTWHNSHPHDGHYLDRDEVVNYSITARRLVLIWAWATPDSSPINSLEYGWVEASRCNFETGEVMP